MHLERLAGVTPTKVDVENHLMVDKLRIEVA